MTVVRGVPTLDMGPVDIYPLYPDNQCQGDGIAIVSGRIETFPDLERVPIRIQSSCDIGEKGGTLDCDCGPQLAAARRDLRDGGILFLLRQEGRGAGPLAKLEAMQLQQLHGIDTFEAYAALGLPFDQREYDHVADFLLRHRIESVLEKTNNPRKIKGLARHGLHIVREPHIAGVTPTNIGYLAVKARKGGHLLGNLESYL